MAHKIKYVGDVVKWWDDRNANSYFSVTITRTKDGEKLKVPMQNGHHDHYRQVSLKAMVVAKWLRGYNENNYRNYESDNNHEAILWIVSDGKKRDCEANGQT